MDAPQKQVNFHEIRIGIVLACMFAASSLSLGYWFSGQMTSISADYNQKFQAIRVETKQALDDIVEANRTVQLASQERMNRIERTLEVMALGLETVKKSLSDREEQGDRWSRLQEFTLCQIHGTKEQKSSGMCNDVLAMPEMAFAKPSSGTWQPRFEGIN